MHNIWSGASLICTLAQNHNHTCHARPLAVPTTTSKALSCRAGVRLAMRSELPPLCLPVATRSLACRCRSTVLSSKRRDLSCRFNVQRSRHRRLGGVPLCGILSLLLLSWLPLSAGAATPPPISTSSLQNDVHIIAAVIGGLGLVLMVTITIFLCRIITGWKQARKAYPALPESSRHISRQSSDGNRRRHPSDSGSGSHGMSNTPELQQTASRKARTWQGPLMSMQLTSPSTTASSGIGASISHSGGSGQSSAQSLPFPPPIPLGQHRPSTIGHSSPSITRLAAQVGRKQSWRKGASASHGALPMLATSAAGPSVVHQHHDPTRRASGPNGQVQTLDRSPFFTPQSPETLNRAELRSQSTAVQSLKFGATADAPTADGALASPLTTGATGNNDYENDMVRVKKQQLTLNLGQGGTSPNAQLGEDVNPRGSTRSTQYVPMDGANLNPVTQTANTFVTANAVARHVPGAKSTQAPSGNDLLMPLDFHRPPAAHESQPSISRSQYASYEDMSHPNHARQASTASSRSKKQSSSSDGDGKTARPKGSLTQRIGAHLHFSKASPLKNKLPGWRLHHSSSKEIKGDAPPVQQHPPLPSPTLLSTSLVTPVDHLREASIASMASISSMPVPDQQRYVMFPIGASQLSLSNNLSAQSETGNQELSRSKGSDM